LPSIFFFSEALCCAEERADALEAKLKDSETARKKAEKEAATIECLRQRLKTAEDTLSDREAQPIERENSIVDRFETQNQRFICKPPFSVVLCFCLCLSIFIVDELLLFFSREDGREVYSEPRI
jgi:hypothetical protein